jgi:hypothetical protein
VLSRQPIGNQDDAFAILGNVLRIFFSAK